MLGGRRIVEQQGSLPEVIQDESGKDQQKPRQSNRPRAEVSHVGVQRFTAGDGEKYRAENQETMFPIDDKELDCVPGIEGVEDIRLLDEMRQAKDRDDDEPHYH